MTKAFLFACISLAFTLVPACAQQAQFDVNEMVNPARTGSVNFSGGLNLPLKEIWSAPINLTYGAVPPIIANNLVFALENVPGGQYNLLIARNLATGATVWTKELGSGSLAYDKARLFFVGFNGLAQAFVASTGRPVWTTLNAVSSTPDARAVAYNGLLYVPTYDTSAKSPALEAIDEANGQVVWLTDVPSTATGIAGPTIDASDNAVIYTALGYVASFNLASGVINWADDSFGAPSCFGTLPFTSVYAHGIYALGVDCTSGFLLNAKTGTAIEPINTYGEAFYGHLQVTQPDNQTIAAVDVATGSQIWSFRIANTGINAPLVVNGVIFDFAYNGKLYAFELTTGKRLQVLTPPLGGGELIYEYDAAGEGYVAIEAGSRLTVYKGASAN